MSKNPQHQNTTIDYPKSKNLVAFNRLLLATDFSEASDIGLEYATSIARRYEAQIYVAHVIDSEPFDLVDSDSEPSVLAQVHEQARRKIECMLTTRGVPSEQYHIVVMAGALPDTLINIMRQHHIELAVLMTHGRRGFEKLLMGSAAEEVFRIAPCPVLNIGPNVGPMAFDRELQSILYPVEVVPDPSDAAKYAVSIAELYGGELTIINVMEGMHAFANKRQKFPVPVESWIDDHISKGSGLRSRVYFESGSGPAAEAILDYASDAAVDLIVLGIHARDPIMAAHLPKPDTAYEIVSRAPCPVLTIR